MRKHLPLWIGPRITARQPGARDSRLTLQEVRETLVRNASRTFWQRLADWLDKPVSWNNWS
jgi:hypothetical protein